jgi:hypothetical protein
MEMPQMSTSVHVRTERIEMNDSERIKKEIGDFFDRDKANDRKVRTISWFFYGSPTGWRLSRKINSDQAWKWFENQTHNFRFGQYQ